MTEIIKCWKASNLFNIKRKNCVVSKNLKTPLTENSKTFEMKRQCKKADSYLN